MRRNLKELQSWLRWIISDPRGVERALREGPKKVLAADCLKSVVDQPPLSPERRLDIYAEAYFLRLAEILEKDFPVLTHSLEHHVGEEMSRVFFAEYLAAYPSQYPSVAEIGKNLAAFSRGHEFQEAVPSLPCIAELEWAVLEAFYAETRQAFSGEDLAALGAEGLASARFRLHPSVRILRTQWRVCDLWNQVSCSSEGPSTEIPEGPEFILVYRDSAFNTHAETLSESAAQILHWISEDCTLEKVCENLAELCEQGVLSEAPPLMEWFQHWTQSGGVLCLDGGGSHP